MGRLLTRDEKIEVIAHGAFESARQLVWKLDALHGLTRGSDKTACYNARVMARVIREAMRRLHRASVKKLPREKDVAG